MCGDSSRASAGGTIAVLKRADGADEMALLFNPDDATTTTMATFESSHAQHDLERCQIWIYRTGDLRARAEPPDLLHALPLTVYSSQRSMAPGTNSFRLPAKLDLGVGGEGIIGRRVSLVKHTALGAKILRQGIIGWN